MERNKSEKDLIQIYAEGNFYLEFTEICDFLGIARTSLLRTIDRLDLLSPDDVFYYKNRKLLKRDWVFDFWKRVSVETMKGNKL